MPFLDVDLLDYVMSLPAELKRPHVHDGSFVEKHLLRAAVEDQDLEPFERLLDLITHPFEVRDGCESYAEAAPTAFTRCYQTFCGT